MTSLEDRMRANREVLAELTEAELAATAALQSLNRESEATRQVVQIVRQATANVRTNALIAGMGGGFIVALVGRDRRRPAAAVAGSLPLLWSVRPRCTPTPTSIRGAAS